MVLSFNCLLLFKQTNTHNLIYIFSLNIIHIFIFIYLLQHTLYHCTNLCSTLNTFESIKEEISKHFSLHFSKLRLNIKNGSTFNYRMTICIIRAEQIVFCTLIVLLSVLLSNTVLPIGLSSALSTAY